MDSCSETDLEDEGIIQVHKHKMIHEIADNVVDQGLKHSGGIGNIGKGMTKY